VVAAFDVRTAGVGNNDWASVTFEFPDVGSATPVITYRDSVTGAQVPVRGSTRSPDSADIDPGEHTITVFFDGSSLPTLLSLYGTVFTITVTQVVPLPAVTTAPPGSAAGAEAGPGRAAPAADPPDSAGFSYASDPNLSGGGDLAALSEGLDGALLRDLPAVVTGFIHLQAAALSPSQALPLDALEDESAALVGPPDTGSPTPVLEGQGFLRHQHPGPGPQAPVLAPAARPSPPAADAPGSPGTSASGPTASAAGAPAAEPVEALFGPGRFAPASLPSRRAGSAGGVPDPEQPDEAPAGPPPQAEEQAEAGDDPPLAYFMGGCALLLGGQALPPFPWSWTEDERMTQNGDRVSGEW
jgi:hypothetical protein